MLRWLSLVSLSVLLTTLVVVSARFPTDIATNRGFRRRLQTEEEAPKELFFSVTYRDFLPSSCFYIKRNFVVQNQSLIDIQLAAWNTTTRIERQALCDEYSRTLNGVPSGFLEFLNQRVVSGHPDFEALGQRTDFAPCTIGRNGTNFPVSSCIREKGPKFGIIQEELRLGSNGLLKPVYCDESGDDARCGLVGQSAQGQTLRMQTTKQFFDSWYNDDLFYNKRIGQRLLLKESEAQAGLFVFDSGFSRDTGNEKQAGSADAPDFLPDENLFHFGPLDRFKTRANARKGFEVRLADDPFDLPAWPSTINQNDAVLKTKSFYFTTELHTTFEFREDEQMVFSFTGDDDFWVFINGKMVIDLGGVHTSLEASIDLNSDFDGAFSIKEHLQLEDRGIYTLDIFHAERQTSESSFKITTTLFPACSVLQSGTPSVSFKQSEPVAEDFDVESVFSLSGAVRFDAESKTFTLQQPGRSFTSSFMFTKNKENVAGGFVASFDVLLQGSTQGFAFVIQAFRDFDLPLAADSNFNLAGLQKSFAVVFDLCANFPEGNVATSACEGQRVSVHHPDNIDDFNNATDDTRRTTDFIARRLSRNEPFPVEIVHFGSAPQNLEVYINGSLYLRETDFDISSLIGGGTGAHVGFTASSTDESALIQVRNFELRTVGVFPPGTSFLNSTQPDGTRAAIQEVLANGQDVSSGLVIETQDFCERRLDSGTLEEFVDAKYVELRNPLTKIYSPGNSVIVVEGGEPPKQTRDLERLKPNVEDAVVVDNDDGTYTLRLKTKIPADYILVVAFGENCRIDFEEAVVEEEVLISEISQFFLEDVLTSQIVTVLTPVLSEGSDQDCFFKIFEDGEIVAATALDSPVVDPRVDVDFTESDSGPVLLFGLIAGCIAFSALVGFLIFIGKKRQWDKEKVYVPEGEVFKTEMNTHFDDAFEYSTTSRQVLGTQQELLELKSQKQVVESVGSKALIGKLSKENKQLKDMVRGKKQEIEFEQDIQGIYEGDEFEEIMSGLPPPPPIVNKPEKKQF